MDDDDQQCDERTAYHEAGHATIARCLGGRVQWVSIAPDDDDRPRRYGDTRVRWQPIAPIGRRCEQEVLTLLAGPVAEMIYVGDPLHPGCVPEWADDWHRAWQSAAGLIRPERPRLAMLEQLCVRLHQTLRRDDHWAALAALADELLAHQTLESEMIDDVLSAWLRLP